MKISIETSTVIPGEAIRVGNVYAVKGGYGTKRGHMQVLMAITEPPDQFRGSAALMLIIDRDGNPVGVSSYGVHVFEERQPIAFVEGLDQLNLSMRSI